MSLVVRRSPARAAVLLTTLGLALLVAPVVGKCRGCRYKLRDEVHRNSAACNQHGDWHVEIWAHDCGCSNPPGAHGEAGHCQCHTHWTGAECQNDALECKVHNGGCAQQCHEQVGAPPLCTCDPGFVTSDGGKTCTEVEDCYSTLPCLNGGVCSGQRPQPRCTCSQYWTGSRCEVDVKECKSHDNGGCDHNCVEVVGGPPVCRCRDGYDSLRGGAVCQQKPPSSGSGDSTGSSAGDDVVINTNTVTTPPADNMLMVVIACGGVLIVLCCLAVYCFLAIQHLGKR